MNTTAGKSSEAIKKEALRNGFEHCGITPTTAISEEEENNYRKWLEMGNYGGMAYLRDNFEKRLDPRNVLPGAQSVIALLLSYYPAAHLRAENNYIISKYAYGKDYHIIARNRLRAMEKFIRELDPGSECKSLIDSGVLMEKYLAEQCGVGWRGKNTLVINTKGGSFYFIAIMLTTTELSYDLPETDHCGTCDRCIRACPTGALEMPHVLNPLKCISYQTIENPEPIPGFVAERLRDRVFGCDICQDVCPFNQWALPTAISGFHPSEKLQSMRKPDWETLAEKGFEELFHETGISRTGYRKLMGNIAQARSSTPPSERS